MQDWLMYWKYYWQDIKENPDTLNDEWHNSQKHFGERVGPGDSLWVVITGGQDHPDERLLQRIVVQQVETLQDNERPYTVIGDPTRGQKCDVQLQEDLAPLLKKLEFEGKRKISAQGKLIGAHSKQTAL